MASHLSDIGFDLQSAEDFQRLSFEAYERGESIPTEKGVYVRWSPGEGIELWLQLDRNDNLIGMNPHFAASSVLRVGLTKRVHRREDSKLDGAFHGWANPSGDEPETGDYPFVFDTPDYGLYEAVKLPCILEVQMAAFAHEMNAYESDEAHHAAQADEAKFASESFIPSGLFTPEMEKIESPKAHAIFSGHILETALKTNPVTNKEFYWAKVQSYGGQFDVVADPFILDGTLKKGGVISGTFWLSGRLINHPTKQGAKRWKRWLKQ